MNRCKLFKIIVVVNLVLLSSLVNLVGLAKAAAESSGEMTELSVTKITTGLENISSAQTTLTTNPALSLPPAMPPQRPLLNGTSILTITNTANPTSVAEPGGVVTYTVFITNTTVTTDITVITLTDSIYGNLDGQGNCLTPQVLTATQSYTYTCAFTATVSGNAGQSETNIITATAQYSGTNQAEASDDATVTISNIMPDITIQKDNNADGVLPFTDNEEGSPGATVTFRAIITNNTNEDVTIDSISDDHYGSNGDLTSATYSPNCASVVSTTLTANDTVTCYFDGTIPNDDNLNEINTLRVDVSDDETNPGWDNDTSTVTTSDLPPFILVNKSASPDNIPEPGGSISFTASIINLSTIDPVTITSLIDTVHGNLNGQGNCSVPQTIAAFGSIGSIYQCVFPADVLGNAGDIEFDEVIASGTDDDNNPVSDSGSESVTITDLPSSINVIMTANPTSVPEPGATVDFTVQVSNTSVADSVTINTLTDTLGSLHGRGDCDLQPPPTIAPGSFYQCTFPRMMSGNAGDNPTNQVAVNVTDDDGVDLQDSDTATVDIDDVPSSISVTVTPNPSSIPEPGGTIAFTVWVSNTSPADSITITSMNDDIHGNLNGQGDCSVPQAVAVGGFYQCTFTADVSGTSGYSETNTTTVQATDDDGVGLQEDDDATVNITEKPTFTVYLPIILKPPPTELSVWNNTNTGKNITFTVLGTSPLVSCTVEDGHTDFCGSFPPGIYNVQVASSCSGAPPVQTIPSVPFPSGPVTKRVFCN